MTQVIIARDTGVLLTKDEHTNIFALIDCETGELVAEYYDENEARTHFDSYGSDVEYKRKNDTCGYDEVIDDNGL